MARLRIITAMVAFGTLGPFIKRIPLPSSEIALYRGLIALLVLAAFLFAYRKTGRVRLSRRQLGILFFSGAAMGFNWILLFEAYRHTSVALATLSYYFAPTVVVLVSVPLFREHLSLRQGLCFLGSTAGVFLIIGVSGGNGGSDLIGILFGLGAAVLYATVVLSNKAAGHMDGILRTLLQFAAAVVILVPYVAFTGGFHLANLPATGWIPLLIVGVVHTGVMYFLYFTSIPHLKGQQAAILSYIDPVVAVLVSVLWLNESMTPAQWVGGGMILLFTLLNELGTPRQSTQSKTARNRQSVSGAG